jgi:hypothetical protein
MVDPDSSAEAQPLASTEQFSDRAIESATMAESPEEQENLMAAMVDQVWLG